MAEIQLNKNKIDGAVKVATMAVAQEIPSLSPVEALVAFSQVVGRVIGAQEGTAILHQDMMKLAFQQIEATVRASYAARGSNSEALNG